MQLLPAVRRTLVRHPLLYWCAVVALAVGVGAGVASTLRRVDGARRSWGATTSVWVATADAEAGQRIHVDRREYPEAMVPAAAVLASPADALARQRVSTGEIIVSGDVSSSGLAGLVPAGYVAMAVPQRRATYLSPGYRVVAYAGAVRLAEGTVVAADDEQVVVAVLMSDAAVLSEAIPRGTALLALAP
ncbi:MAG: hypothetical protein ABIQ39_10920 [Ilumatobacteraceae bacterium]